MKRPRYHLRMTDEEVKALREEYVKTSGQESDMREALMLFETVGSPRLAWFARKVVRLTSWIADADRVEMRKTYDMPASDEAIRQDIRDHLAEATKFAADLDRNIDNLRAALFQMRSMRFWWLRKTAYIGWLTLGVGYFARRAAAWHVRHYHRIAEKELSINRDP